MEIPIDRQLFLLNAKLVTWQNTYYDASLDVKIAQDIGNEQLLEQGLARMKQALQAIAWVQDKITALEGGEQ